MIKNGEDWPEMIKIDQERSGSVRTGQECSGLVRKLVRYDQDWSGVIL